MQYAIVNSMVMRTCTYSCVFLQDDLDAWACRVVCKPVATGNKNKENDRADKEEQY